jgi:hypothetical protein
MKYFNFRGLLAGLMGVIALMLLCGSANATTVSSATGQINFLGNIPPEVNYAFTLTDHAQLDGFFDPTGVGGNVITVTVGVIGSPAIVSGFALAGVPGTPFSFNVADLGPGDYVLKMTSDIANEIIFSGFLKFSPVAVAATPVPPAVLMFLTAIGGLGFAGWHRRRTQAA